MGTADWVGVPELDDVVVAARGYFVSMAAHMFGAIVGRSGSPSFASIEVASSERISKPAQVEQVVQVVVVVFWFSSSDA
jgi:hypothetical protein